MHKDVTFRLRGIRYLIHSIHHNITTLEYLSYNLHKETFNTINNSGLYMIWSIILEHQVIYFYKLLNRKEKFSFNKLLNIAENKGVKLDYEKFRFLLAEVEDLYEEYNFEILRSKFIAHLDIDAEEFKAELPQFSSLTELLIKLLDDIQVDLGLEKEVFDTKPIDDITRIFEEIDEYERVKAYITACQIKGQDSINIRDMAEKVNPRQSD